MSAEEASTAVQANEPHTASGADYAEVPQTFSDAHENKIGGTPAADTTTAAAETKADETTATAATGTAAAGAATSTEPKEEKVNKKETAVTATPITSGTLGYKAPGLVNQLRFKKHHFWIGDEPVDSKALSSYLRGEKPETANPTAAWASHTGKGLLFFAKSETDKKEPSGALNLVRDKTFF